MSLIRSEKYPSSAKCAKAFYCTVKFPRLTNVDKNYELDLLTEMVKGQEAEATVLPLGKGWVFAF